ncbi:MAG: ABC transporter permease [Desulfobulbaceae bacterium]|nr:ABC transporter permease [Desulfobulbaceae bacterium]
MTASVQTIPFVNLALAFIPVFVVAGILYRWTADGHNTIYAVFRMLVQLLLIGYFLIFIFESDSAWVVLAVLVVMLCTSSWISLRTIRSDRWLLYKKAFLAITLGGGLTLLLVTQGVLGLDPWYMPRYLIPLAGMIFANAMNSVSLGGERLTAEMARDVPYEKARSIAFRASLIPITNSLFAVGLVSLPGMMTGQILSGVSPLIAARYQIMVMCMVFASAGISSACFLKFLEPPERDNCRN